MVRVFLAEVIPDDFPRAVLVGVAKLPSKVGRFICSHVSESRPLTDPATSKMIGRPETSRKSCRPQNGGMVSGTVQGTLARVSSFETQLGELPSADKLAQLRPSR